jgi:hypothetical protein
MSPDMLSTVRSTPAIQLATSALFLCILASRLRAGFFTRQTTLYACFNSLGLLLLWYRHDRDNENNNSNHIISTAEV